MATEFSVLLAARDAPLMDAAFEALESLDEIERTLTVYRDDSEIARINAAAGSRPIVISGSTFELIRRSIQWSEKTGGAFDITAGPLVDAWGFTERRGRKPSDAEIETAMRSMGHQHIHLDAAKNSVLLERPGMRLNLGAIGKGFALDQLAERLCERGLNHFLIHGGGSSVLARGHQTDAESGWAVGISHPTRPQIRLAGLRLHDQSLSTSGSGKQFFHFRGQRYGHVIDPRTGYPGGHWLSLTAVSQSATDAEALSTAYYLASAESIETEREASDHDESDWPALIGVSALGRQDEVAVQAFGEFDWVDPPPEPQRQR